MNTINEKEYNQFFPPKKREEALKFAFDIRKFEIELYWKRASYFWTLIAATLIGYTTVAQRQNSINEIQSHETTGPILVLLSCIGIVFSFGWFLVNKGSKYWHENWENHVDMLEDDIIGPLYKTVLSRPDPPPKSEDRAKRFFTGPGTYSVSKINQLTSFYIFLLWTGLLLYALFSFSPEQWEIAYCIQTLPTITITIVTCILFIKWGTFRNTANHLNKASLRQSSIITIPKKRL